MVDWLVAKFCQALQVLILSASFCCSVWVAASAEDLKVPYCGTKDQIVDLVINQKHQTPFWSMIAFGPPSEPGLDQKTDLRFNQGVNTLRDDLNLMMFMLDDPKKTSDFMKKKNDSDNSIRDFLRNNLNLFRLTLKQHNLTSRG
jgi:hypothetical protein